MADNQGNDFVNRMLESMGSYLILLGEQLGLASLQNLSIEHLGALHLHPLNKPLHVPKGKED